MIRLSLPQNYRSGTATLFEDFETVGDWTVTGSSSPSISADTTNYKTGTKSLKLTTGLGTSCTVTKTINLVATNTGVWGFWMYVYDVSTVSNIQIQISSDTAFTNRFVRTISSVYLHSGWNFITLDRGNISSENNWGSTGTIAWSDTMIRLRATVTANASVVANVSLDSLYYSIVTRPKIVIMFDDGWDSAYTEGFAYMEPYGLKGSVPVNSELVGTANHATLAQLQEMYNAGWDMLNHTTDHTTLTSLSTVQEVLNKITPVQDYLISKGMTRNDGYKHFIYPSGAYNDTVLAAVAASGSITAGTVISRVVSHYVGLEEPYLYTRRTLGGSTLSVTTAKQYIDTAIANGGTYVIYLHKLVSGTEANTNEWQVSKWRQWVDYLAGKHIGRQLDVMTFTEWYKGLSSPRSTA